MNSTIYYNSLAASFNMLYFLSTVFSMMISRIPTIEPETILSLGAYSFRIKFVLIYQLFLFLLL